jgi:hypothetical protein
LQPSERPPIFIHSGWRCSSTYLWSRFRAVRDVLAYYEPWHEQLARLTPEWIERERPATSGLRHPDEGAPYLAEFTDLMRPESGVAGYRQRFALDDFFLDEAAEDPDQVAYLDNLIAAARSKGRTPVLACCRTLGRIGWLRRRFDGAHIVLIRDPVQQWRSFHSLRKRPRPTYFELCQYVILSEAQSGAGGARRLGLTAGRGALIERIKAVRRRFKRAPARVSFAAFIAVYMLSYLAALPQADLVIDVDRLGADPDYARTKARRIADLTGVVVDFSDCRPLAPHPDRVRIAYRKEAVAMVDALGVRPDLTASGPAEILYGKLAAALPEPPARPSLWKWLLGQAGNRAPAPAEA